MSLINTLFSDPTLFLVIFLSLILSIGLHEFAHVLAAYLQGDRTGADMGRLSLNPIKHIDLVGLFAILVAGIGWGKPAPFNPNNLRFRRWGTFLVAIAGPVMNILLVAIFGYALAFLGPKYPPTNLMIVFFNAMMVMNATLAVFNLIPVPPLDGSRLFSAILGQRHPIVLAMEQYGFYFLFFLIIAGQGFISAWIHGGTAIIYRILGL